ncbi:hypothetical protein ACJX0J_040866 [Zea mays]
MQYYMPTFVITRMHMLLKLTHFLIGSNTIPSIPVNLDSDAEHSVQDINMTLGGTFLADEYDIDYGDNYTMEIFGFDDLTLKRNQDFDIIFLNNFRFHMHKGLIHFVYFSYTIASLFGGDRVRVFEIHFYIKLLTANVDIMNFVVKFHF